MKAIGFKPAEPGAGPDALVEFDAARPEPGPRDLLVEIRGVSLNPVDVKVRARTGPAATMKILGYDGSGIVRGIGSEVTYYSIGDEVFYAGDITREGTNAEFHAVDERIVGRKPQSLSFAESAGLPLTSITSWEILFDCFSLNEGDGAGETLLIIGGAGGVGSILIQLAKKLTRLSVIATASRPETTEWVKKMGADHVINHRESLSDQMTDLGIEPRYVASLNGTSSHFPSIVKLIKPRGHITIIDDPGSLDIRTIKNKALTLSWELMFTRSMFHTDDMERQRELHNRVSRLIDEETLVSTVTSNLGALSAETLKEAHIQQENGRVIGKNVLQGFAG